ncbi:MAG: non-canonical purine NTP pyrophosphatase [Candidatus Micrarchaeota archaeon]
MKIFFCTTNEGKFLEARSVLSELGVSLELNKIDLSEPKVFSINEIVLSKARRAFEELREPVLVEDTGLFLLDYQDFPGAFSKVLIQGAGLTGFLRLTEGTSRQAEFRTLVAFKDNTREKVFEGKIKGSILTEPRGNALSSLQYDSVFVPEGWSKTFAEAGSQEKNKVSHRALALRSFGEWITK